MNDVAAEDIPPMWPNGSDGDYIAARIKLARAERRLRDQVEEVAAARRAMPAGKPIADYTLATGPRDLSESGPSRTVSLRELFGEKDTLFVYHLMFHPDEAGACPMCSMWVDGFRGVLPHLEQNAAVAVVAKAPLPRLRLWGRRRGWDGLQLVSSYGTTFNHDMNAELEDGSQRPMASVYVADGPAVRHFYTLPASFIDNTERGIDLLSPVWNVLDLLPRGRGEWYAQNSYVMDS
jgi:predicted dithiol-disulfide oxidoreductase (DUF899 family)